MQIKNSIEDNKCFLHLHGDFDAECAQKSRDDIEGLCMEASFDQLIIDMRNVEFLDSSGVGALVYMFKRMTAKNISMNVEGLHGQPAELMKLLRMDQAISIHWENSNDNGSSNVSGATA